MTAMAGGQWSVKRGERMTIKSYRDLEVWQKAMDLVVVCYEITKEFPKNEIYGLTSQLQRAAVSIPTNIAEGQARQYTKEFIQYLSISYGSIAEVETLMQIAEKLNYLNTNQLCKLMDRTAALGRMINGLRKSLEKRHINTRGIK